MSSPSISQRVTVSSGPRGSSAAPATKPYWHSLFTQGSGRRLRLYELREQGRRWAKRGGEQPPPPALLLSFNSVLSAEPPRNLLFHTLLQTGNSCPASYHPVPARAIFGGKGLLSLTRTSCGNSDSLSSLGWGRMLSEGQACCASL